MANLLIAALCETVITDRDSNLVSYINLFSGIQAVQLPARLAAPITLASIWLREHENDTVELKVRLSLPDGSKRNLFASESIRMEKPQQRVNLRMGGVTFEKAGQHVFELYAKRGGRWRKTASLPVDVEVRQAAGGSEQP